MKQCQSWYRLNMSLPVCRESVQTHHSHFTVLATSFWFLRYFVFSLSYQALYRLLFPHFPEPSTVLWNSQLLIEDISSKKSLLLPPPHPQIWTVCSSVDPDSAQCCSYNKTHTVSESFLQVSFPLDVSTMNRRQGWGPCPMSPALHSPSPDFCPPPRPAQR